MDMDDILGIKKKRKKTQHVWFLFLKKVNTLHFQYFLVFSLSHKLKPLNVVFITVMLKSFMPSVFKKTMCVF